MLYKVISWLKNKYKNSVQELRPIVIKDVMLHTMEDSLHGYLEMKIHHLIKKKDYKKILVIGKYDRTAIRGNCEKNDKIFNWERPTAKVKGDKLIIQVPTGKDYVQHYASLIATYLAINNRGYKQVFYIEPNEEECERLILESNIQKIGLRKTVIIGFGLPHMSDKKQWLGKGPYLYKNITLGRNKLTLLGCQHSLWGDISSTLTKQLAKLGVKKLIYIGKLGVLNKGIAPNEYLATGNCSYINGREIEWNNFFQDTKSSNIIKGKHFTSPSILMEDKKWLGKNKTFDFS